METIKYFNPQDFIKNNSRRGINLGIGKICFTEDLIKTAVAEANLDFLRLNKKLAEAS